MTDDIAEVAKGLTKAQHTALWNLGIIGPALAAEWQRAPHDGWRRAGQACTNLVSKGLTEKCVEDCGVFYRLTPLGLAVLSYLQSKGGEA